MLAILTPLLSGLLFGFGLLVSGMNNPAKVQGFLDIFGQWQPELMAVMASSIIVFAITFTLSSKMKKPFFHTTFHTPKLTKINLRLLIGAMLFGIGWAIVGLCPGPALVDLLSFKPEILVFIVFLLLGNRIGHYFIGQAK